MILRLLERKFGEVPERYRKRLAQADAETLLNWGIKIIDTKELKDIFAF